MKYLTCALAVGLCVALVGQGRGQPRSDSPRSVPVIVQDVMQPSRMVAVADYYPTSGWYQIPIDLAPNQVFVLTSAAVTNYSILYDNFTAFRTGSTIVDKFMVTQRAPGGSDSHHCYPSGIRFPGDGNGQADLWVECGQNCHVAVQGYITDDF